MENSTDVIGFLNSQHEQVKGLFERVLAAQGTEREETFFTLRRLMAIHETAEEEIVHPAAKRAIPYPDNEAIVNARLKEENTAKKAITELETLDVDSEEFETKFRVLQRSVLEHAQAEEEQEFSALATRLEPVQLQRMRKAVSLAETIAPTSPRAGIESPAANLIAGPFVAMVDRARDALSGEGSPN